MPAVLGLRPALSPTRSLRRLESSVVIDVGPIRSVRVTGSTSADRSAQPFPGRSPASPRGQDNVRSPRASQLGQCPENGIPWEWREAGWAGGLSVRLTSVRFSYLFFDGVASVTPRRNIARPADFLRTCEATRLAETALARYSLAAVPNHFEGTTGSSDGGITATLRFRDLARRSRSGVFRSTGKSCVRVEMIASAVRGSRGRAPFRTADALIQSR